MPKSSVCGVRLATWGTHDNGGNGLLSYIDTELFGGNVGHASLSITFPVNKETTEWIKKYCLDPPIPYEKHKVTTKKAVQNPEGKYVETDENVFEEEVYVVNFSWFPGLGGHALSTSLNQDGIAERIGHHTEWDPRFRDYIQPEMRYHKGKLGSQLMTYGARDVTHERNLSVEQRRILNLSSDLNRIGHEVNSLQVLEAKFAERIEKNSATPLTPTELLLLDNFFPQWREKTQLDIKKPFSSEQARKFVKSVKKTIEQKEKEGKEVEKLIKECEKNLGEGLAKELHEVEKKIQAKEQEFVKVKEDIANQPFAESLHKKALLLLRELKVLRAKEDELKKADINQYNALLEGEIKDWGALATNLDELLEPKLKMFENAEATTAITSELASNLDKAFDHIAKMTMESKRNSRMDWRNNHVKSKQGAYESITKEEAIKLREFVKKQLLAARQKALAVQPALTALHQSDFENFSTTGLPPSHTLHMQIGQKGEEDGLDVESMLQEIHKITTEGKKFDLDSNNCSVTVGRILHAGATTPHLKAQFDDKALGAIGNPQMVFNNAKKYIKADKSPKDTLFKKLARFQPLKRAGGWCVKTLFVDKQAPISKKIAAGVAAVPIGLARGITEGAKKLANPLQSFKELVGVVEYANSRPSKLLGIGISVLAAPAFAVLAAPAGIQAGAKLSWSGIKRVAKTVSQQFTKEESKTLKQLNVDLSETDLSKGLALEEKIKQALKGQLIEIHAQHLEEALNKFNTALQTHSGPVVLDAQTEKMVLKELSQIKDKTTQDTLRAKYHLFNQISLERIQDIQKGILVVNNPPAPLADKQTEQPAAVKSQIEEEEEKIVKVADADYKEVEQFYSVMPILGKELAQQIPSHLFYVEKKSKQTPQQIALGLPPTVDPDTVTANKGYLVSQAERDYILKMFAQDDQLQEVAQGTSFPPGHPQAGIPLSCSAFKDNHGNIYVMNNPVLGRGSFGTIKIIQALKTAGTGPVTEGGFYAVKIQNTSAENSVSDIRHEMAINERFGLHFGDLVIKHKVVSKPPQYAWATDLAAQTQQQPVVKAVQKDQPVPVADAIVEKSEPTPPRATSADQHEPASGTKIQQDEPASGTMIQKDEPASGTMIQKDEPASGTMVQKDEPASGTMVQKDEPASGTMVQKDKPAQGASAGKDESTQPPSRNPFSADYAPPPDVILAETETAEISLSDLADKQGSPTIVEPERDLDNFKILEFLELFELMTAEVEKVHNKGVLHRDIKAENFLYTPGTKEMKLIDFGIARFMDEPELASPAEMLMGSPQNMPPEMFHEDFKEKTSTKQDIYALARTFELLIIKEMHKYYSQAYKEGVPSPLVPADLKVALKTFHMQTFLFKNPDNDPHIAAVNNMLQLIHEMKTLHVNQRPEASIIQQRLKAMIKQYKEVMQLSKTGPTDTLPLAAQPQPVPSAMAAASTPVLPASTQKHIDYLNNFIKIYDEMSAKDYGYERQQRMREELRAYKTHENAEVRALAMKVLSKLGVPRTAAPQSSTGSSVLFSATATSIQSKPASSQPSDPQKIAEALLLCKEIIHQLSKQESPPQIKRSAQDTSARVLTYLEQALGSMTAELAGQLRDLNNQTKHIWQENQNPLQKVLEIVEAKKINDNLTQLQENLESLKPKSSRLSH